MNILFVSIFQISEQKGGTERTTARISDELRRRGHRCFNLYKKSIGEGFTLTEFDNVYTDCSAESVCQIIDENHIDSIILEGAFTLVENVYQGREKAKCKPKMYFVHHFAPGFEPYFNAFYSLRKQFMHAVGINTRIKSLVKMVIFPIYKPYMDSLYHKHYRLAYELCDKIILLSPEYVDGFCKYGDISDKEKFASIPNAVSFDEFLTEEKLKDKRTDVLIVSRFDEVQKRISKAIKIWRYVEDDPLLDKWHLRLVGYGESYSDYVNLVKRLGLKRVSFEGKQNPIEYYKSSSVFMMTSLYEGWPMTLNESMQFGCVPVVYDTCASFHEIICDGENGYLVKDGNEHEFYERIKSIALGGVGSTNMMSNAIESSKRFQLNTIAAKWEQLMKEN